MAGLVESALERQLLVAKEHRGVVVAWATQLAVQLLLAQVVEDLLVAVAGTL
jgi:hypothetical protein